MSVEAHFNRFSSTVPSHSGATWTNRIARDADSSNLVNFPFAFIAFTLSTVGVVTICWGMAVISAWLTAMGFLLTLGGVGLCGGSVSDN